MKQSRERSLNDKKDKNTSMTFRLESELKEKYITFCENNGMSYGKRLRLLIKQDIENNG